MPLIFPAPPNNPNPMDAFIQAFMGARAIKRQEAQQKFANERAVEEEKLRREQERRMKDAQREASDEFKAQQALRQAEFEHRQSAFDFEKTQAEHRNKIDDTKLQLDFLQSMRNMRRPEGGTTPFSLKLGDQSYDVQPMTADDAMDMDVERTRRLNQVDASGLKVPGFDTSRPVDHRVLGDAVGLAEARARIAAAAQARAESGSDRVLVKDLTGAVTGLLDKSSGQVIPVGSNSPLRTAPVPQKAFEGFDAFKGADAAVEGINTQLEDFIKTPITSIKDKYQRGSDLNSAVVSMSRTIGRSLGERGMFTEGDRNDFIAALTPGVAWSTLDPEFARHRLQMAKNVIVRAKKREATKLYQRYGGVPSDMLPFLDKPGDDPEGYGRIR